MRSPMRLTQKVSPKSVSTEKNSQKRFGNGSPVISISEITGQSHVDQSQLLSETLWHLPQFLSLLSPLCRLTPDL
jgi:hypothetical protein